MMDQLDKARDVACSNQPSTSKYQQSTSKRCTECGVGRSTSATWRYTSSRAIRIATSSPHLGRGLSSLRKCSSQAPISNRLPTVKSSPTPRTLNSYVDFTLSLSKLCLYSRWLTSSGAKTFSSACPLVMPDPSHNRGWASLGGC
jgi:hypothetical protein